MQSINLVTASELLGICRQRIQQLIYAHLSWKIALLGETPRPHFPRVKGAFKSKQGWQLPLYRQMPQIIPATRGVKGTWRTQRPKTAKIIHVNRQKIARNQHQEVKEPVIAIRKGSKVVYGYQVSFDGPCTIVYEPDNGQKHFGAKVWIEVSPTTSIKIIESNPFDSPQVTILD